MRFGVALTVALVLLAVVVSVGVRGKGIVKQVFAIPTSAAKRNL